MWLECAPSLARDLLPGYRNHTSLFLSRLAAQVELLFSASTTHPFRPRSAVAISRLSEKEGGIADLAAVLYKAAERKIGQSVENDPVI